MVDMAKALLACRARAPNASAISIAEPDAITVSTPCPM
jgi:hypothetical protein